MGRIVGSSSGLPTKHREVVAHESFRLAGPTAFEPRDLRRDKPEANPTVGRFRGRSSLASPDNTAVSSEKSRSCEAPLENHHSHNLAPWNGGNMALARISHHVEMMRAGAVENTICEASGLMSKAALGKHAHVRVQLGSVADTPHCGKRMNAGFRTHVCPSQPGAAVIAEVETDQGEA